MTWKDEQKWLFRRPVGAIPAADTDNPLTEAQAGTADDQGAKIGRDVARWRRDHGFLARR